MCAEIAILWNIRKFYFAWQNYIIVLLVLFKYASQTIAVGVENKFSGRL
jgi:hypothetical protein